MDKRYGEQLGDGLFRILVPFEAITTTVYVAVYDEGVAIIDSATYPSDVDGYILPALAEIGVRDEDVRYLLFTHDHGDHAGGLGRLREVFPRATVGAFFALSDAQRLTDGQVLLGGLQVVHLSGHTDTAVGFLDRRTDTLLSGDCLQLGGVDKYRDGVSDRGQYEASIEKLRGMTVRRIVAAHEYDPLGSIADGEAAVKRYLDECIRLM